MTDVTHSNAYKCLNAMQGEGVLSTAQVEYYKSKYAKLHEAVLQTYENEKNMLKTAKSLNQDLAEGKKQLEAVVSQEKDVKEQTADLKAEAAKAEAEVALCDERDAMLQLEIAELQRQQVEIKQEKEDKEREVAEQLAPRITALELAIDDLKIDITRNTQQKDRLREETVTLENSVGAITSVVGDLAKQIEESKGVFNKIKGEAPKFRKQGDLVEIAVRSASGELDTVGKIFESVEHTLSEQATKRKQVDEDRADLALQYERHRTAADQKDRIAEEIRRNVEQEKEEAAVAKEERLRLDLELKELVNEHKRALETLHRRQKEKETSTKEFRKVELSLSTAKGTVPNLVFQREDAVRRLQQSQREKKDQLRSLEELNRDVDVFINNFLQEESLEKDKAGALAALIKENKELEANLAELSATSFTLNRQIFELSMRRDSKAREYAKAVNNRKQTDKEIKVKEIVILDLSKRAQEKLQQLQEYTKLYEIVKNERNKYVNLIQATQQAAAEMREKLGILQNEIDILHNESVAKDKSLGKERMETQNVTAQRDGLRAEANRVLFAYREKQEVVDQQIAEIDKLNSIINNVEKEMVRVKRMYEVAVEERNYTGIQLIDRNDELCILYEKSNIQEQILRNGEYEFMQRVNEIRVLKLECSRLNWKVEVTQRALPRIPEYKRAATELQKLLAKERRLSQKLSFELESPSNTARWRILPGRDLEPEELALKVAELEERLNDKKEMLLEKELVLEEVSQLSDRLRRQAAEGREETVDLAKRVNDMQARIKAVTRKMMACVSELSLYQATAMKLEGDQGQMQELLAEARERLEKGEAPTEDAERDWQRMLRAFELREVSALARAEEERLSGLTNPESTAEPRPNAYIPDDGVGLPKPYGRHQPFKPLEPGSTMRHITKPNPREIQI